MRFIDLTQPWSVHTPPWPYFPNPQVELFHSHHRDRVYSLIVKTAMHTGTHMDAPSHLWPTGWNLDQIPLERHYGTGLVIDISQIVEDWTSVTVEQVRKAAPEEIREGDIVVLHAGWHRYNYLSDRADEDKYFCRHPGPSNELVDYLIGKKVRWVGVDFPAFEHPLNTAIREMRPDLVEEYEAKMGGPIERFLPRKTMLYSHRTAAKHNIMFCENLAGDIERILNRRITLAAFPWRFVRGEASICRVVAIEE
ncbi:MAG: cyclase family protein [Deltaproteobacteria bacterium]|nr:cyclase family protein [Deltaproteobacteria bacterium]